MHRFRSIKPDRSFGVDRSVNRRGEGGGGGQLSVRESPEVGRRSDFKNVWRKVGAGFSTGFRSVYYNSITF